MEKKYCRLCQTQKDLIEFAWRLKHKELRQSYCKACQRIRSRAHYKKYSTQYIRKAKRRKSIVLKEIQEYMWNYLASHPCIDCGESDIVVLEFDHIGNKLGNLSEIIKNNGSLRKVKEEIEKCQIRCANCHRRKTAKDYGWKKASFAPLAQQIEHLSSEQRVVGANPTRGTQSSVSKTVVEKL